MDAHEIESVLKAAVEERTFSLDAVNAIKELRESHAQLEGDVARLQEMDKQSDKRIKELTARNAEQAQELMDFKVREGELFEREMKCTRTEVVNEFQAQRVDDLKTIMLSLTRNLEYRRELNDSHTRNGTDGTYSNNTNILDEKTEAS